MKKIITGAILGLVLLSGCAEKTKHATSKFIKDKVSIYDNNKTIEVILNSLKAKNYKLVGEFNHEKAALALKQMLYPTKTVEFINTKISTKLISCNPSISLELPLRFAVYNEINGRTHIVYTDPEYWSLKHNVRDEKCINLLLMIKQDMQEAVSKVTKPAKK